MPELLKERYNKQYIKKLANAVHLQQKHFPQEDFIRSVFDRNWHQRELKARMTHISDMLNKHISGNFKNKLRILTIIAPEFTGYEGMFIPHFIESQGLDHWTTSMKALEEITPYASGEFAIRQFILSDQERAMNQMMTWSKHANYHVRRLSSEGCRPRLPWACALPEFKKDPRLIIPILSQLKEDESLYVRKSVANNLNDISKDNPQIAQDIIRLWQGKNDKTDWILKHGSRTLLKAGNTTTLKLFSYPHPKHIVVEKFTCDDTVKIGDMLTFKLDIKGKPEIGKLRLEYRIDFAKASGKTSKKIFQIMEGSYQERIKKEKKHSFKQLSTRKHYPGKHRITLVINGIEKAHADFLVKE